MKRINWIVYSITQNRANIGCSHQTPEFPNNKYHKSCYFSHHKSCSPYLYSKYILFLPITKISGCFYIEDTQHFCSLPISWIFSAHILLYWIFSIHFCYLLMCSFHFPSIINVEGSINTPPNSFTLSSRWKSENRSWKSAKSFQKFLKWGSLCNCIRTCGEAFAISLTSFTWAD